MDEGDTEQFHVDAVTENKMGKKDWMMTVKVNGTNMEVKLHTGAQANVI